MGHNIPHTEETKRKISETVRGKKWINNGIEQKMILRGEEIPEGFQWGRLPFSDEHCQRMSTSKKGLKRSKESIKKQIDSQKKKRWFHNPKTGEKLFIEPKDCPQGWIPGMKRTQDKKIKPKNEITNAKGEAKHVKRGLKWVKKQNHS